jgi:hypothetical protein
MSVGARAKGLCADKSQRGFGSDVRRADRCGPCDPVRFRDTAIRSRRTCGHLRNDQRTAVPRQGDVPEAQQPNPEAQVTGPWPRAAGATSGPSPHVSR